MSRMAIASLRRWFDPPINALLTLLALALAVAVALPLARWAALDATWSGTAADCRAAPGGACWAFVGHKLRFVLFGLYPPGGQWRPACATAVLLLLVVATARPRHWKRPLLIAWGTGLAAALWLMLGGLGLAQVGTRLWGGLPVTLMLTVLGLALGFPAGIALALGRRSSLRLPRIAATAVVETVRGVPLIAVLYLAALVFPLALPGGVAIDKLLLAQAGIALFASAYLAEAVRAGLQAIPKGQTEAALALGLGRWQALRRVVLPQALTVVVPSLVSIAIGFLQDTSLVVVVGLFDLLNTARVAAQDPDWLGFHAEAYAFVGLLYFGGSVLLSRCGLGLERHASAGRRPAGSFGLRRPGPVGT